MPAMQVQTNNNGLVIPVFPISGENTLETILTMISIIHIAYPYKTSSKTKMLIFHCAIRIVSLRMNNCCNSYYVGLKNVQWWYPRGLGFHSAVL